MAPPTQKPRLSLLDADRVARDVAHAAVEHLGRVARLVEPGWKFREPARAREQDELRATPLYLAVHSLALYATQAEALGKPVREVLAELVPLHASVLGFDGASVTMLEGSEPDTALGLVICAAIAREKVEGGTEPLSPVEVGALAGLDPVQVRTLAHAGEVPGAVQHEDERRRPWTFAPKPLKKWLKGRDVVGF